MKEILINRACGLDVHRSSITACIKGQDITKEIKTFGTTTQELKKFYIWLETNKITHVAMESTGIYWKPIFNIIGENFECILVNAKHIKNVPGRKTDVKDSEWLCNLLRAGLLRGSFIPPETIRNLRDLTRYQKKLCFSVNQEKNRVHKLLHESNIKISEVLSNIFGKVGTKILIDLSEGITDPKELIKHFDLTKRLEAKKRKGIESLEGKFKSHHSYMLKTMLNQINFINNQIEDLENRIETIIQLNYEEESKILQSIPGISKKGSSIILSEIGTKMENFPTSKHFSSWAGLCPGNNESAGKKKNTRLKDGNKYLKSLLIQSAWSVIRKKDCYYHKKYYSIISRLGQKKALCVIAHKLLLTIYEVLKKKESYKDQELCIKPTNKEKLAKTYIKKLGKLGFTATLSKTELEVA